MHRILTSWKSLAALACVAALPALPASATTVTTYANGFSGGISPPEAFSNSPTPSVGEGGPRFQRHYGFAAYYSFELPDLSASPVIESAVFSLELTGARDRGISGQVPNSFNADLYFLGSRATPAGSREADYGDNAPDDVPAGAILLVDDWWVAGDDTQIGITKTADLTTALADVYSGGTPSNPYLALALYADVAFDDSNDLSAYFFRGAEPCCGPPQPDTPSITIEAIVPEPSTGLLVSAGLLALAHWRRSRRRSG